MIRNLAEVGIAFVDLLSAQARELGAEAQTIGTRLAVLVVFGVMAGGMALGGAGLLVWALYQVLAEELTSASAAALTGVAVWIVIGVGGWVLFSRMRRPASRSR